MYIIQHVHRLNSCHVQQEHTRTGRQAATAGLLHSKGYNISCTWTRMAASASRQNTDNLRTQEQIQLTHGTPQHAHHVNNSVFLISKAV